MGNCSVIFKSNQLCGKCGLQEKQEFKRTICVKTGTPSRSWDFFPPSPVAVSVFVTEADLGLCPGLASSRMRAAGALSFTAINGSNDSTFPGQRRGSNQVLVQRHRTVPATQRTKHSVYPPFSLSFHVFLIEDKESVIFQM